MHRLFSYYALALCLYFRTSTVCVARRTLSNRLSSISPTVAAAKRKRQQTKGRKHHKDQKIERLAAEVEALRVHTRILTDQVSFHRSTIRYYKRIVLETKRDKENLRRALVAYLGDMDDKLDSKSVVRFQSSADIQSLLMKYNTEKNQLIDTLKANHADELKQLKMEFRAMLEKRTNLSTYFVDTY